MFNNWLLKDFEPGGGLAAGVLADNLDTADWIGVDVPGDVYLALVAAGRIAHPFDGMNERDCGWVEQREWWYRCRFSVPAAAEDERLVLSFLGLDTFARVWLNGVELGSSDNMFRPVEFDIGGLVRRDEPNTLAIRFEAIPLVLKDLTGPSWPINSGEAGEPKRNLVRKAQFGWGWDWGPRMPTVGIWRPVELRRERRAAIRNLRFSTLALSPSHDEARIAIEVDIASFDEAAAPSVDLELISPSGATVFARGVAVPTENGQGSVRVEATLGDPALWWTHDLGAPDLHRLHVRLSENGVPLDTKSLEVGIRTVELDTSPDPDEPGTSFFRFVLNGVPLFAKGACWIPASSFVGAIGRERYDRLIGAAADSNMNMIRIWGGGIYEHDAFYDACDRLGLLVWQDFMFACAPYPDSDEAFVANVREEVRYQVTRLRNRASLALWCGNNECQVIQQAVNRMTRRDDTLPGEHLYNEVILREVAALDPATPYWPGSPFGGTISNSMNEGDVHDWTVWHGFPPVEGDRYKGGLDRSPEGVAYTRYAEDMGRFISEYGIQASPALETLRRHVPSGDLVPGSAALEHRIKDVPKNKVDMMMTTVTGLPASVPDYVDFTMITQAEGLKFGIEHFRRRSPHCSGSLIWQFNDCWPGVSWSLLDYYGFAKAGYHYVKRAYAPVLASFKPLADGGVELWITNDRRAPFRGEAIVELGDFAHGNLWTKTLACEVGAGESRAVHRFAAGDLDAGPSRYMRVRAAKDDFPCNRHFFAAIKDLVRDRDLAPVVRTERTATGEIEVTLKATAYLHFVHLVVPHEWTRFSDNYFDLAAGEERRITVSHPDRSLSPEEISVMAR